MRLGRLWEPWPLPAVLSEQLSEILTWLRSLASVRFRRRFYWLPVATMWSSGQRPAPSRARSSAGQWALRRARRSGRPSAKASIDRTLRLTLVRLDHAASQRRAYLQPRKAGEESMRHLLISLVVLAAAYAVAVSGGGLF